MGLGFSTKVIFLYLYLPRLLHCPSSNLYCVSKVHTCIPQICRSVMAVVHLSCVSCYMLLWTQKKLFWSGTFSHIQIIFTSIHIMKIYPHSIELDFLLSSVLLNKHTKCCLADFISSWLVFLSSSVCRSCTYFSSDHINFGPRNCMCWLNSAPNGYSAKCNNSMFRMANQYFTSSSQFYYRI